MRFRIVYLRPTFGLAADDRQGIEEGVVERVMERVFKIFRGLNRIHPTVADKRNQVD